MASDRTKDYKDERGGRTEDARAQRTDRAVAGDGAERRRAGGREDYPETERRVRRGAGNADDGADRAGKADREDGADIEKRRQRNKRRQKSRRAVSVIWKVIGGLVLAAFFLLAGLFIYCRCVRVSYLNSLQLLFTGRFAELADTLNTDKDVTLFTVKGFLRNEYADDSDRFVCSGNALYKISNNSIVRYTDTGNMAQETRIDMDACRYDRAGDYLLVYGMGSKRAYLVTGDMILTMDMPDAIRTATVNAGGYTAFVTEPAGYASAVAVYGPDGKEISTRYIQSDYAVWAGVAPDNSTYCVNKLSLDDLSSSSYMEYNRLGEANSYAQELMRDRLIADCVYLPCGSMVCITDSSVMLVGGNRQVASEYEVSGISAVSVTREGRVLVAATVVGNAGNENRIMIFDTDGSYSYFTLPYDVDTMDADSSRICITNGSGIVVTDYTGAAETSLAAGEERARDAILYGDSYLVIFRQTVDKRRF